MGRQRVLLCLTMLWSMLLPGVLAAQDPGLGITLPRALTFAVSPSPIGSGARAQGQGSAFIGIADDATAASHNPGGLVQLERPEVSLVGSYFIRTEAQDVTRPDIFVDHQSLDSFALNYMSVAIPFRFWQRHMVASVNFQRLFDFQGLTETSTVFSITDAQGRPTGSGRHTVHSRQDGGLFTLSPALAVQLTPTLSVGVAVNIWPSIFDNGWQQDVQVNSAGRVFSGNRFVPFTSTGRIQEEFDFEGVNVTTGFLWTISSVVSLGGVFRSPFTARVTRSHRSTLQTTLDDGPPANVTERLAQAFRERLDLDMPMSYGLGLAARLSPHFRVALDVARVHWSDFRLQASCTEAITIPCNQLLRIEVPVGKGQAVLSGKSTDTTSVRLGAEYLWPLATLALALRGGLFYDPEPGDGRQDDFFGGSLGAGIASGPVLFDLAYTFRAGTVHSPATDPAVRHHTVLASVIYHF